MAREAVAHGRAPNRHFRSASQRSLRTTDWHKRQLGLFLGLKSKWNCVTPCGPTVGRSASDPRHDQFPEEVAAVHQTEALVSSRAATSSSRACSGKREPCSAKGVCWSLRHPSCFNDSCANRCTEQSCGPKRDTQCDFCS